MDNREEFEQWFEDNYDKRGRTVNLQMKMDMWIGWQAARNDAWLLRKQAEAVIKASNEAHSKLFESGMLSKDSGAAMSAFMDYADRLRQQADEAENE